MTHQLDMMPGAIAEAIEDPAALEHLAEQLPKAREVTESRFPNVQINISIVSKGPQAGKVAEQQLHARMHPVDAIKAAFALSDFEIAPEYEAWMRAYCDEQIQIKVEPVLDTRARDDHR